MAAGLLLGLGCEAVAPLQPLPGRDSGTDVATPDRAGESGATDASVEVASDRSDVASEVGGVPDATRDGVDGDALGSHDGDRPDDDGGDGAKTDDGDALEDDGGDAAPDGAPDAGVTPDAADGLAADAREGDTATDGGDGGRTVVLCDPSMPFGDAIPVHGLNRDLGTERHVNLSPDELTAYLSIGRTWAVTDIYTAKRASTMQPFGSPMPIVSVNSSASELAVSTTADGLTILFDSDRSGFRRVYVATRATTDSHFGSPRELVLYSGERSAEAHQLDPYVLPDGSALYFTATAPSYGFYRAALNGTNAEPPVSVMISGSRFPVVSQDELTLHLSVNINEDGEIMVVTRSSREFSFGGLTNLTNLNTPNTQDAPGWLSPDGCRMYFTRTFPGDVSISLVAERQRN